MDREEKAAKTRAKNEILSNIEAAALRSVDLIISKEWDAKMAKAQLKLFLKNYAKAYKMRLSEVDET